jgi:hypothetical protein
MFNPVRCSGINPVEEEVLIRVESQRESVFPRRNVKGLVLYFVLGYFEAST